MKKFKYRKRWITFSLKEALALMEKGGISVITLTGARQTGKTTLVRNEEPFNEWDYINLDNLDVLAIAKTAPEALLKRSKAVIVDEVQRAPELLLKVKELVDTEDVKFLLTGSANLLLLKKVSETLAGRTAIFTLAPFASREWEEKEPGVIYKATKGEEPKEGTVTEDYPLERRIIGGSMPSMLLLKEGFRMWWEGYVKTYIERDLRDISSISNLADFHRLLETLAHVSGGLLEESSIARRIGLSVPTTHRWINLLETSYILFKLRPYLKSRIARIRKAPKIYLVDSALSFHLMGTDKRRLKQEDWGRLFENFVFLQLYAMQSAFGGKLYYWRLYDSPEREVDFIWERAGKTIAIEAKYKDKVSIKDAKTLLLFCEQSVCEKGFIVYKGNRTYEILKNIWTVPVWGM